MTREETNLLTLKPYYRIRSTATGRLYIDKDLRCYLFESDRDATQFCEQYDSLEVEPSDYIKQAPFISKCYGLGFEQIRIKEAANEQFVNIKIEKDDARRQFYNRDAIKSILRLKQTKKKKYLRDLSNAFFIAPMIINPRKEKEYPVIQYCFATLQDDTRFFLLFVTLHDFDEWNASQGNKYAPCKTTLAEFNRIRKKNPILINPTSDCLFLTDGQISDIMQEEILNNAQQNT